MRLVLALICARALALPSTRGRSLEPGDLERKGVAKCCHCGFAKGGCWQDAALVSTTKLQKCKDTCAKLGVEKYKWEGSIDAKVDGYYKVHMPCALLRGNKYRYNPDLIFDQHITDLYNDGGGKMCTTAGETNTNKLAEEFKRVEDEIADAKGQAKKKREEADELESKAEELYESLRTLGAGENFPRDFSEFGPV